MADKFYKILLYKLYDSISSVRKEEIIPDPELILMGATDLAVKMSSKETVVIISKWTSNNGTESPGYGNIVAQILKATSALSNLLSSAVFEVEKAMEQDRIEAAKRPPLRNGLLVHGGDRAQQELSFLRNSLSSARLGEENFVDHKLAKAKASLVNIEAKLVTLRNRLGQIKRYIEQGQNMEVPIRLAALECEEILEIFSDRTNILLDEDNILFTSPSFMAFVGIYAGAAGFQFQMFPSERRHVVMKMKILKRCVEDYREEAVSKRLRYVKSTNYEQDMFLQEICYEDKFNVIHSCESCPKKFPCEGHGDFHGFSNNFTTSLEEIYRGYFDKLLEELGKLVNKNSFSFFERTFREI